MWVKESRGDKWPADILFPSRVRNKRGSTRQREGDATKDPAPLHEGVLGTRSSDGTLKYLTPATRAPARAASGPQLPGGSSGGMARLPRHMDLRALATGGNLSEAMKARMGC